MQVTIENELGIFMVTCDETSVGTGPASRPLRKEDGCMVMCEGTIEARELELIEGTFL